MATKKAAASKLRSAEATIAKAAMAYPETIEENPWGHRAFKVKKKVFLFLGGEKDELSLSVKLPHSNAIALSLPFAEPTRYGLGKSGWVSASFSASDDVPTDLLLEWVDESFRAIAPKKVVSVLTGATPSPAPAAKPTKKAPPKKAVKKAAPKRARK